MMDEHNHVHEHSERYAHDTKKDGHPGHEMHGKPGQEMHHEHPVSPDAKKGHGHGDQHAHMAADFRKRFWVSLIVTNYPDTDFFTGNPGVFRRQGINKISWRVIYTLKYLIMQIYLILNI